jgi:hypothetical protein
VIFAAFV